MSEAASAQAADTPPVRSGAAAFIFVTILLDMLALGLILPILPKLVESFVDNDTATAALNRWFEEAVQANPPPAVSGRRLKLNYITQTKARPPSFVLFCSRADAVPQSYLRYLTNSLREAFELPGTPVRITLREKANPFAHKRKRPS